MAKIDLKDASVGCLHGLLGNVLASIAQAAVAGGGAAAAGTTAAATGAVVATGGAVVAGAPLLLVGLTAYLASGYFTARSARKQHEKLVGLIEQRTKDTANAIDEAAIESAFRDFDLNANIRDVERRLEVVRELVVAQREGIEALRVTLAKHEGLWISLERFLLDNFDALKADLSQQLDTRFAGVEALIREALAQRPVLEPPTPLTDYDRLSTARYLFSARRVELLGRENELREINAFLDDARPFRWALWTGEGGQGKTRLAFEVMLDREARGWRTGRLPRPVPNHPGFARWDAWEPREPTLIVIDYAAAFRDQLPSILEALARRAATPGSLAHPVRVLLLERPGQDELSRALVDRPSNEAALHLRAACANGFADDPARGGTRLVPRQLEPLSIDAACKVIEAVWRERRPNDPPPSREAIRAAFADAEDFMQRPLFAAFAGDALASGEGASRWNSRDLAEHVLKSERTRWKEFVIQDDAERARYERLLALATMTRGFALDGGTPDRPGFFDHDAVKAIEKHLPPPEDFADKNATGPRHYAGLIGFDRPDAFAALGQLAALPGLEPDLLGELFLMQVLGDCNRQLATALGRAAWLVAPLPTAMTAVLLTRDFGPDTRADALLALPRADDQFVTRLAAAMSVVDRVSILAGRDKIDLCRSLYAASETLGSEEPVRVERAEAAVNLISDLGNAGLTTQAREVYDAMASLGTEEPVRVERAQAAFNLISDLGNAGLTTQAREVYDAMASLGSEEPVRVERAKAAVNLILALGKAGLTTQAREVYDAMASLGSEEPVRVERAQAAVNLIVGAWTKGGLADRAAAVDRYETLASEPCAGLAEAEARGEHARRLLGVSALLVSTPTASANRLLVVATLESFNFGTPDERQQARAALLEAGVPPEALPPDPPTAG